MNIVILDQATISCGDEIDFSAFHKLGTTTLYANLSVPSEIIAATQNAQVIVLNKVNLDAALIAQLSSTVKLIAITATGYDNVDVVAATKRGIKVCNVPGYGTNAVAQLAVCLMLNCATQFVPQLDYMREQGWNKQAGLAIQMHELAGKTLGVVGLGEIGTAIARLGLALGMQVIAYNRSAKHIADVELVSLEQLAAQADFISLSCALTADTQKIINAEFLAQMKPSSYLINTARGGLIDEAALVAALQNKQIAGAALDVLCAEPPAADHPLLSLANVILTPHIGWAPIEARQRCVDISESNINSFIYGNPLNLLN